jgi:hypothetical protein
LHTKAGIEASTIDRLLATLDRPGSTGFDAMTVVVVDEAAMVGTRKFPRLNQCAAAAGTSSF